MEFAKGGDCVAVLAPSEADEVGRVEVGGEGIEPPTLCV